MVTTFEWAPSRRWLYGRDLNGAAGRELSCGRVVDRAAGRLGAGGGYCFGLRVETSTVAAVIRAVIGAGAAWMPQSTPCVPANRPTQCPGQNRTADTRFQSQSTRRKCRKSCVFKRAYSNGVAHV
jgi:hypothetical protein